ncbi:MAG: YfcE family phosphodiesterase [Dehalococcoidia bacterium]|nr:YfcE family phosphodiesterase [Dehalococcoidia bacterium]
MKIGLIADTHIPITAKVIPPQVAQAFKGVDMILHAGDIQITRALDELEQIAPVYAATGNNDYFEDHRMKPVQIFQLGGLRVAVLHVFTYPNPPLEHFERRYFDGRVDVVVYGDTHVPEIMREDGVVMINPGSPTSPGPNMYLGLGHVGILEISEGQVEARLVSLLELKGP